jgi:hypothetical protein
MIAVPDSSADKRKIIYLASVYSWPYDETVDSKVKEKRFRTVAKCAGKIHLKGEYNVYSPIAHCHPIQKYAKLPFSYSWYEDDLDILRRMDELWIMDTEGWNHSIGIKKEIELAKELGLRIRMVTPRGRDYKYKEVPNEIVY